MCANLVNRSMMKLDYVGVAFDGCGIKVMVSIVCLPFTQGGTKNSYWIAQFSSL